MEHVDQKVKNKMVGLNLYVSVIMSTVHGPKLC